MACFGYTDCKLLTTFVKVRVPSTALEAGSVEGMSAGGCVVICIFC
jgi:hypothetical protein